MLPWLEDAGLGSASELETRHDWYLALAQLVAERAKRMSEIAPLARYLFVEEPAMDPAAAEKAFANEDAGRALAAVLTACASLDEWNPAAIEAALRSLAEVLQFKPKVLFQVVRVAVSGSAVSLPLFESMWLIGRERVLARLEAAQSVAAGLDSTRGL
jgi:glutamyl-tRNA synthetase